MGQAAEVIVEELVLALVGLSAGAAVAGGLFSFIVELGVIADFADRTHTGDKLLFYETCVALGGIIGNPQLIAASAKLNIGLKKMKCSPPTNGIHAGQFVSMMGK